MIEIEEIDGGFRVVDAAKNQVEIQIDDWEPGGEDLEIGHDVTKTLTGRGTEIRLPESGFLLESSELDHPKILSMNERVHFQGGDHLFRLDANIWIQIRVAPSAAVSVEMTERKIILTFPAPTRFTLGFEGFDNHPAENISIPPTVEGVAAALDTYASMHDTETPDRSFPSERPIPPGIELNDETEIELRELNGEEGQIKLRVPQSLEFLFPAAPLSFYIGAKVTVEPRAKPILEVASDVHEFSSSSVFSDEVGMLLRRVFYLDCLVREAGPRKLGIKEFDLLDDTPLDPERLYECSILDRIEEYLEFPFETIDSDLPEWPLGMFVEPTMENLPSIPFLIDKLAMVFPPRSTPLDRRTWVGRSLDDFYRSTTHGTTPDVPIEVLPPEDHRTHVQGWIAPGNPVDAFKCVPESLKNQRDYLVSSSQPISINVVLNDEAMDVERSRVVEIYRNRAKELSVELEIVEGTTTEELAQAFESASDFLHYIGHCDPSGFRCIDGNLSTEELSESRARTFFLNACGSYTEGLELVRRGSVAGAVTFGDIIDGQATKVGGDFARMYMYGFTIERALYHARGQAIMNRQYAIVGDGTHILTQGETIQPTAIHIIPRPTGNFSVRFEAAPVNLNGGVLLEYAGNVPNIMGNHEETQIDRRKLKELLNNTPHEPIIYENKFYWPEELLDELF